MQNRRTAVRPADLKKTDGKEWVQKATDGRVTSGACERLRQRIALKEQTI